MPYTVQFIGLVCFQPAESGHGRRALLPDGRFPEDPAVQPHLASISVDSNDLLSSDGWRDDQVISDPWETEFVFPPSTIALQFDQQQPGAYAEKPNFSKIPRLKDIDDKFNIGDNANWIGSVAIEEGHIETFLAPGFTDPLRTPLLGELTVPWDDEVTITVTSRKGWPVRRIVVKAGSEIAIINTSRGPAPRSQRADHFQIYAELSSERVALRAPAQTPAGVDPSQSRHPRFRRPSPATFTPDCIITQP